MKSRVSAIMAAAVLLSSFAPAFAHEPSPSCDGKCPKSKPGAVDNTLIAATPRADAPSLGPRSASVTVEVWSDFECPFCARGASVIEGLRERYGDKIRIVFRHMPLPTHADAKMAAAASMAAHEQGKFWEMHDVLFENQRSLDRASLEKYAKALGLDLERFRKALDTKAWNNYVEADFVEAQRRGIAGTPTFFINGTGVMGAQPLDVFAGHIDAALKR
ncbi:DsbA family protein [Myxococcus sp. CA039A]|uniref:DsbA family protein n=1 Tax=Myxococcus sp. CA039A TaxID=2741737 RepID=UPI00157B56B7|nr:DsbA family protein [Myxococcus sp. CA039A]NTX56059.1 thioredoxin domain-containing protein [Myxococcus sp. CA039A]